jgi:hypothetical protein
MAATISPRFMAFLSESREHTAIMHPRGRLYGFCATFARPIRMKPIKAAMALGLAMMVLHQTARGAEWAYCIAPADAQNRIYVSNPFPVSAAGAAEPGFDIALTEHRLPHDTVECARAENEAAAIIMRQHAVAVNRQWGRQVIDMPWRPLR